MQIEFRVGTQSLADGTQVPPRLGRQGDVITSDGHARYYEIAYRSSIGEANSYASSNGTAGVAPGTALSTTPPFVLWNPPASGKNLYVLRVSMGLVSGSMGLAQLWYAYLTGQITKPTGGTVLSVTSTVIGILTSGAGQAFQGSTLIAAPSVLRPAAYNWGAFVTTGTTFNTLPTEEIAGNIMVAPGGAFCIQAVGAGGTAPLVVFGVEWGEEKI